MVPNDKEQAVPPASRGQTHQEFCRSPARAELGQGDPGSQCAEWSQGRDKSRQVGRGLCSQDQGLRHCPLPGYASSPRGILPTKPRRQSSSFLTQKLRPRAQWGVARPWEPGFGARWEQGPQTAGSTPPSILCLSAWDTHACSPCTPTHSLADSSRVSAAGQHLGSSLGGPGSDVPLLWSSGLLPPPPTPPPLWKAQQSPQDTVQPPSSCPSMPVLCTCPLIESPTIHQVPAYNLHFPELSPAGRRASTGHPSGTWRARGSLHFRVWRDLS